MLLFFLLGVILSTQNTPPARAFGSCHRRRPNRSALSFFFFLHKPATDWFLPPQAAAKIRSAIANVPGVQWLVVVAGQVLILVSSSS